MNAFLADVRDAVAPARGNKDGLLPPLLTMVTGLVDALLILVAVAAVTFVRSGPEPGSAA